jgi:hypothetical protein
MLLFAGSALADTAAEIARKQSELEVAVTRLNELCKASEEASISSARCIEDMQKAGQGAILLLFTKRCQFAWMC